MKQAIILRNDLKMGKGKAAAQACHASVTAVMKTLKKDKKKFDKWESEGQKKIVLKVNSKQELLEIFEKSKKKTCASLIKDAGLTQLKPGESTAVGIGPDKDEIIDLIISDLKLL